MRFFDINCGCNDALITENMSSRGRVVKALDLKSNELCSRRFESCRLRNKFCNSFELNLMGANNSKVVFNLVVTRHTWGQPIFIIFKMYIY
jgi:hypothetical protein